MAIDNKIFFLVEFGSDSFIEDRKLFSTNDEAKNYCKNVLGLQYNRKNGFWQKEDERHEGAQIIILTLEDK